MRRLAEDRGAILRMAGNIAGGMCQEDMSSEEAHAIVDRAVEVAIAIVRELDERIAECDPPRTKPAPTTMPGPGESSR